MRSMFRRTAALSFLLCASASAACVAETPTDSQANGESDLLATQSFAYNNSNLSVILATLNIHGATLVVKDGKMTFTPSAAMATWIYPSDPNPNDHVATAMIPGKPVDISPCGTATATITSLNVDMTSAAGQFNADHLDITAGLTATIHVDTGNNFCPNFDAVVDAATVDIPIFRPTNVRADQLSVGNVTVNITQGHADNCKLGWICNHIVDLLMGNKVASGLQDGIHDQLAKSLADPSIPPAIDSVLGTLSAHLRPPEANNPWKVVAGSLRIGGSQATWAAQHWIPAVKPTGCFVAQDTCNGWSVDAFCNANGDKLQMQHLVTIRLPHPGGIIGPPIQMWQDVEGMDPHWNAQQSMVDNSPPMNSTESYRVCARNVLGDECTDTMTIFTRKQPCTPTPPGPLPHP
jgi:hypothetical protein